MTLSEDAAEREPSGQEQIDPPGAVSSQNGEEAERGHRTEGTARPDPQRRPDGGADPGDPRDPGGSKESAGGAGEGSQSTGHPENAG